MVKADEKLFEKLMAAAIAKLELARTYLEDGALASAASNLREAADFLERAAGARIKAALNGDKVWGGLTMRIMNSGTTQGQCETIVRAKSKREALYLLQAAGERVGTTYFNNHWAETGNRERLELATEHGVWVKGTKGWVKAR
jgi:hypothetical protein